MNKKKKKIKKKALSSLRVGRRVCLEGNYRRLERRRSRELTPTKNVKLSHINVELVYR